MKLQDKAALISGGAQGLGKREEYALLAVYLAPDEHYLSRQTISPNGGMIL